MNLLFYMPSMRKFAKDLTKTFYFKCSKYQLKRFQNQELQIILKNQVKDKKCLVLGNISPPDNQMIEFFLLCDTLKKEGAKNITALLPYLSYMRQDKNETSKSWGANWISKLSQIANLDKIITFDIHSQKAQDLFKIPVISLSPREVFTKEIQKIGFFDATLIAPDKGAIPRVQKIQKALGKIETISFFKKKRVGDKITSTLYGKVGQKAIIIDDQLDTGNTLISVCKILKNKKVNKIIIMVTHGLFTGKKWQKLFDLNVQRIYITDTVPTINKKLSNKISVLSILPIIKKYLELEIK